MSEGDTGRVSEGDECVRSNENRAQTLERVMAEAERPLLRVLRGEPTPEELAALVAVLAARQRAGETGIGDTRPRSQWRNRARNIRPPIGPGPGAWRASGLPR